jgi:hypothetical protein
VNGLRSTTGERRPQKDAWILCAGCGEYLRIDKQLTLRVATPDEVESLPAEHREILASHRDAIRSQRLDRSALSAQRSLN